MIRLEIPCKMALKLGGADRMVICDDTEKPGTLPVDVWHREGELLVIGEEDDDVSREVSENCEYWLHFLRDIVSDAPLGDEPDPEAPADREPEPAQLSGNLTDTTGPETMTIEVTCHATLTVPVGATLEGCRGIRLPDGTLIKPWVVLEQDADTPFDLDYVSAARLGVAIEPGDAEVRIIEEKSNG